MATTPVTVLDRLRDMIRYIEQGRIVDAMNEFYAQEAVMQENANKPMVGLAANLEREKQFLSGVKEWKGFTVTAMAAGDNVTFYESQIDFIATNGQPVHMEQVSVAKWRNGKIIHERYYYDPGRPATT